MKMNPIEHKGKRGSSAFTPSRHCLPTYPGYIYTHLDWPKPRQKAVSAPGETDTFKEPRGAQTLEHPIEPSAFWPRPAHSTGVVDTLMRRSGANLGCEDRSADIAGSTRSQRAKLDVALALLHASPGATMRRDRV